MPICEECKEDKEIKQITFVSNPFENEEVVHKICTDCWFHKYEPNGLGGYDKKIVL